MDFTSALYLGLRHAHVELAPWRALTLGKPAALETTHRVRLLARQLTVLTGGRTAILGTSTLHLFWDLCTHLAQTEKVVFLADAGLYPIAHWGLERAKSLGATTIFFRHHDPSALRRALTRGARPIAVTDGFCPACGRAAPLDEYLAIVREMGGGLLIDDTQALGILGPDGGGTVRASGIAGDEVMQIGSLAKGFGAPLAVLSGSRRIVHALRDNGATRIHCGPPSEASVAAGLHAMAINAAHGDSLRAKLTASVRRFRRIAARGGVSLAGGQFPVQTCFGPSAESIHQGLLRRGIQTVLLQPKAGGPPAVSFLITAAHHEWEIASAGAALTEVVSNTRKGIKSHVELAVSV